MVREIKFRVWDKTARFVRDDGTLPDGKPHMKYDVGIMSSHAKHEWAAGIDGIEIRVDSEDFELMQYTGLKDKNGKEIYEGDILKMDKMNGSGEMPYDGKNQERLITVFWSEFRSSWSVRFNELANNDLYGYVQHVNHVEVIGNIYENPVLIKQV